MFAPRLARAVFLAPLLALSLAAARAETRHPASHFFQPKPGDIQGELATARAEGKTGVLIMFESGQCRFCQHMKSTVLNRPEVQDYFRQHFLIYPVDVEGDAPMTDFAGQRTTEKAFALGQRVRTTPVFIFYGLEGQPLTRYTGATQGAAEFQLLGRYVVEGAYKGQGFSVYKRQSAAAP